MVKDYNKMALRGMPMTDEEHASEMALNTGIIIPSELFHTPAYNDFILDAMSGALLYALDSHNLTESVMDELAKSEGSVKK